MEIIKYKVVKDVMGSAFMMDDILKDHGLMACVDKHKIEMHFHQGGLYLHIPDNDFMEDIMEEFYTRDFTLAYRGKVKDA